jgi:3-hydroxypropanoate dehydrogenase
MNAPEKMVLPTRLSEPALNQLFRDARTHSFWQPLAVSRATLEEVYALAAMGPTSANTSPARFVFLTTPEARQRLLPALMPGNVDKTMAAPVVAIIAYDTKFYDALPTLFPQVDARSWFVGNQPLIDTTASRNSALQGAYLMLAARSLGLDCGAWKVNFICNLGYGDAGKLFPRNPRLRFDQACRVI